MMLVGISVDCFMQRKEVQDDFILVSSSGIVNVTDEA